MAWEPDYLTVSQLKSFLRVDDTTDDLEIEAAITAASRAIDHYCDRQFGVVAAAEERTYEVEWSRRYGKWKTIAMDDLSSTSGLVVTVSGSAVTTYTLLPRNASEKGEPYTRMLLRSATSSTDNGPNTVLIEGVWGWSSVPATVEKACRIQAARYYHRKNATFGIAGSPDFGSELRMLDKVDADVEAMLRHYRRHKLKVG